MDISKLQSPELHLGILREFFIDPTRGTSTIDPAILDQWNISNSFKGGEVLTAVGFGRTGENKRTTDHLMHSIYLI